jgi:DnaJ-class molecular chaperone
MQRLFEPSEVTLEDTILGAWEALTARSRAECPVCHGELVASGCTTCGSQLA